MDTESKQELANLLFGEDGRSAYTHTAAWDYPVDPRQDPDEEVLTHKSKGRPFLVYASMAAMDTNLKQLTNRQLGRISRMALWPRGLQIKLPPQCRYHSWTAPLRGDLHHVILAHPAALASTVERYPIFYLIRPQEEAGLPTVAPPAFFEFLNRTTTIPMKPQWSDFLWTTLKADHAITLCNGHATNILRCAPNPRRLLERITAALQEQRIH